jgi:hypothetical protein
MRTADSIEFPKVDDPMKREMIIKYTCYKSDDHTWRGEYKTSSANEIDLQHEADSILMDLNNDPYY